MMGKRNLLIGVITGAVVGGAVSLFNRETRDYVKTKCDEAKTSSSYYVKNPSEAIQKAKVKVDSFNRTFSSGADNALNALEQVGDTLEQFTKPSDKQSIE
jgi:gas vesicle protein